MAKTKRAALVPETRTLFARIPADLYRRLKVLAANRDARISALVSDALDRYLRKEAHDGQG
jgi:hypothetical protein